MKIEALSEEDPLECSGVSSSAVKCKLESYSIKSLLGAIASKAPSESLGSSKITQCFGYPVDLKLDLKPDLSDDHSSWALSCSGALEKPTFADHNGLKATNSPNTKLPRPSIKRCGIPIPGMQESSYLKFTDNEMFELEISKGERESNISTEKILSNSDTSSESRNSDRGKSKKLTCKECNFQTSKKWNLEAHVKVVHRGQKSHACTECNYRASKKSHLLSHINSMHESIKTHACPECDYRASRKDHLLRHVTEVHRGLKPSKQFACKECDYKATKKDNLKGHINSVHKNIKPHECTECEYKASRKAHLKVHINSVHKKPIKPNACTECDYTSSKQDHLLSHINAVHRGLKKCACSLCPYTASKKKYLIKHIKAVHKIETIHDQPASTELLQNYNCSPKGIKLTHNGANDLEDTVQSRHNRFQNSKQNIPIGDTGSDKLLGSMKTESGSDAEKTKGTSLSMENSQQDLLTSLVEDAKTAVATIPLTQMYSNELEIGSQKSLYHCRVCVCKFESSAELECHIQSMHYADCI